MTVNLKNQVAVITGAGSGIGRAIALGLAAHNVSLCLIGRNTEKLHNVAEQTLRSASITKTYRADLASDQEIYRLIENIEKDFKHVHMLIHSAGDFSMGEVADSPVEDFDRQFRINVRAPYLLTQCLLPAIKSSRGQIVFINSSAGIKARAKVSQYAATKHALKALADSLRDEVNADGIRVLSIYPGRTATPMQATVHEMEGKAYQPEKFMQPEDVAEVVINALVLPRSAEVTDINIRPMTKF
jgi:short-subunit dehydrogenase